MEPIKYVLGVDVGLFSLGIAAIEINEDGRPVRILTAVTYIHDGGIDPSKQKSADSRRAVSGAARRTRALLRGKTQRLRDLDEFLTNAGYPLIDLETVAHPYQVWRSRDLLASERIDDLDERKWHLSIAVRHMARFRGWRSSFAGVESLFKPKAPSKYMQSFISQAQVALGQDLPEDITPGQIFMESLKVGPLRFRSEGGLTSGKLHQQDNANELHRIAAVQGLDQKHLQDLIRRIFVVKSPKGSSTKLVGKDPLPGQTGTRAPKHSRAFQEFRIAATLANLRIQEAGKTLGGKTAEKRRLTQAEIESLFKELAGSRRSDWDWYEVAELLDVARSALAGVGVAFDTGERASAMPPTNRSLQKLQGHSLRELRNWLNASDRSPDEVDALIELLSNTGPENSCPAALAVAREFMESLTEEQAEQLAGVDFPSGRAAYSADTLVRLTRRIVEHGEDLHAARMSEFGVDESWRPPVPPIYEQTGNPAVDRVLKQAHRIICAIESKWGPPQRATIEHVREGLKTKKAKWKIDSENQARFERNQKAIEHLQKIYGLGEEVSRSQLTKYLAIQRQNGACGYCGVTLTYGPGDKSGTVCEIDHIVPRAHAGSTNSRENLMAVCRSCNQQKGGRTFAQWIDEEAPAGISVTDALARVDDWICDASYATRISGKGWRSGEKNNWRSFQSAVKRRLRQTEKDEPLDSRSLESVAWMAKELASRVEAHYENSGHSVEVPVYRGELTAIARKASGIEKRIPYIGGAGSKTRLDRRHHAVDAAVVALMNPSVARTLAVRDSLRWEQKQTGSITDWKGYRGQEPAAQKSFRLWEGQMHDLADLLSADIQNDGLPIVRSLRLRVGSSTAHGERLEKLGRQRLRDAVPVELVNRAATPALWCALTRMADFDPELGLPENPGRTARLNGRRLGPDDLIEFFSDEKARIKVRNGSAMIGDTIHHARVFRIPKRNKGYTYGMVRVFATDLQRARHKEDVFTTVLPPQSASMRWADENTRHAIESGTAEYLGWLVVGDELVIDPGYHTKYMVGQLHQEFPGIRRWVVDGFSDSNQLRLRPSLLSAEGLGEKPSNPAKVLIGDKGWRASVPVVFNTPGVQVIRRTAIGKERWFSDAGLPVSWKV